MKEQFYFKDSQGREWFRDWRGDLFKLPWFTPGHGAPQEVHDHFAKHERPYAIVRFRWPDAYGETPESWFAVVPEQAPLRKLISETDAGVGFGITCPKAWRAFLKAWYAEHDYEPRLEHSKRERFGNSYDHPHEWFIFRDHILGKPEFGGVPSDADAIEVTRDSYWLTDEEVVAVTWFEGTDLRVLGIESDSWEPELEEVAPEEAYQALIAIDECAIQEEKSGWVKYTPVNGLQVWHSRYQNHAWFDYKIEPADEEE